MCTSFDKIKFQYFKIIILFIIINILQITADDDNKWDVKFRLYTQDNSGMKIDGHNFVVLKTNNFQQYPTKIIVHGLDSSADMIHFINIKREYFRKGKYNIITVDYRERSRNGSYWYVYKNHASYVGDKIAVLIEKLRAANGNNVDIHMIGFSLGCHVIGYAADRLQLQQYRVKRITALEPATLLFTGAWDIKSQLQQSNADFVDVYHTNMGVQGSWSGFGDVDVYINNGITQPGCGFSSHCSHHRVLEIFEESIRRGGFWGKKCRDWLADRLGGIFCPTNEKVLIGEPMNSSLRGLYFVETNSQRPYAKTILIDD